MPAQLTQHLFNDGAVAQLVLAPYDDALVEANLEACRLFRLDRQQLNPQWISTDRPAGFRLPPVVNHRHT